MIPASRAARTGFLFGKALDVASHPHPMCFTPTLNKSSVYANGCRRYYVQACCARFDTRNTTFKSHNRFPAVALSTYPQTPIRHNSSTNRIPRIEQQDPLSQERKNDSRDIKDTVCSASSTREIPNGVDPRVPHDVAEAPDGNELDKTETYYPDVREAELVVDGEYEGPELAYDAFFDVSRRMANAGKNNKSTDPSKDGDK